MVPLVTENKAADMAGRMSRTQGNFHKTGVKLLRASSPKVMSMSQRVHTKAYESHVCLNRGPETKKSGVCNHQHAARSYRYGLL